MDQKISLRFVAGAALIAAILYVCYFSGLDALGLVGPDEPRYAAIAREMAATGDWVTPRLFGQPWFEKPALYYWSAALAYRAGLTDETAARLPSGIFALLATLTIAWSARRFYGDRTALTMLLMMPTCVGMVGFSHAAAQDMPFAASLTVAMVAASRIVWAAKRARQASPLPVAPNRRQSRKWAWACAWGFFLGLATLAKGPAALALPAGSVALWAMLARRWRDAVRLLHPTGILAFCAMALPWYVLCALRNPTFLHVFLLEHNLERFTSNRFQHAQPFWFFAPILLLAIFPWTFLLGGSALNAVRVYHEQRVAGSPGIFFAAWAVFPLLFFSVSQSKLPGYILPCVPPFVLLMARSLTRLLERKDEVLRGSLTGHALTFFLLTLTGYGWLKSLYSRLAATPQISDAGWSLLSGSSPVMIFYALLLIMVVAVVLAVKGKAHAGLWVAAFSIALLIGIFNRWLAPAIDAQISPRKAALSALEHSKEASRIRVYRVSRAWQYGVNYYLARDTPQWTPQTHETWVITTDAGANELRQLGVHPAEELRVTKQSTVLHIE